MVPGIIAGPRSSILHCPTLVRDLLCFGNQGVHPDFELLVFSLQPEKTQFKMPAKDDVDTGMDTDGETRLPSWPSFP